MKHLPVMIAAALLAASSAGASAQEIGNIRQGSALAHNVCAECHAVDKGAPPARRNEAPNFETLANMPGVNAMALRVALQTSHTKMPNLMLSEEDRESVIAYILDLKAASSAR